MDTENRRLLESILVAEILNLAAAIKAEKASKGSRSTSDYTDEAIRLIAQKRSMILRALNSVV